MYCPKCGQQVSDNMRFCSRCGLHLTELANWLSGGTLANLDEPKESMLTPKRKGIRRGAKIMFWGGVITPIFFALSIVADSPAPLMVPMIILLAGFSLLLYSRLFGEEVQLLRANQAQDSRLGAIPGRSALPPATDTMIGSSGNRMRTSEIAAPQSVTDHTTKLLNDD